jgi:response regulator RpfG family c-di-GMP phosphodiesterase
MLSPRKNSLSAFRILLIDYSRQGLAARKALLAEEGYQLKSHRNAEAAVEASSDEPFGPHAIVLSNDSYEAGTIIRQLQAADFIAPIVLLSSIAETAGLTCDNTGASAIIQKSAQEIVELKRTVQRLLQSKRSRKPASKKVGKPTVNAASPTKSIPTKSVASAATSKLLNKKRA